MKKGSSSLVFLAMLLLAAIPVLPQTKHYTTNCEDAREAFEINNPNQLAPCQPGTSAAPTVPPLTTKQMVQQQVAGTLIDAFVNMLFSNDSQANAQKQKMLAELKARQAEAEQQHKVEEAARLAAICDRLQATLKLSGLPALQLKQDEQSSSGSGLQLKLGDDSSDRFQVPNYLTQPLTQPTPPSGNASLSSGALQLKTGDENTSSIPAQSASAAPPADAVMDVRSMTSQQLADLATQINNLPPEVQKRLMDAARNSATPSTSAINNALPSAADNASSSAATAGNPALGQLQSVAASSQAAAVTPGLDNAAAIARQGFDTPGALPTLSGSGSTVLMPSNSSATRSAAASFHGTPQTPAPAASSAPVINLAATPGTTSPATVAMERPAAPQPQPAVTVHPPQPTPPASAPCPQGLERTLPPRRQIIAELERRRAQLDMLKNIMLRLNKSIQLDQKQYDEWGKQAQKGYDDLVESVQDLTTDTAFDSATDMLGWRLGQDEEVAMKIENEAERMAKLKYINGQAAKLEMAGHLKTFYDYENWALSDKEDWEMIDGGVRQLITFLPLAEEPMYAVESAELLIDDLYEVANWRATWQNLSQLDHNTDQYLQIVKQNGEQMRKVVERIQELETQLKQTQDLPREGSACTAGSGGGLR